VLCGVVWCGVVWCGVVWCGVMWSLVWCGQWCASHTLAMAVDMVWNALIYSAGC